jgi:hypothetical protein
MQTRGFLQKLLWFNNAGNAKSSDWIFLKKPTKGPGHANIFLPFRLQISSPNIIDNERRFCKLLIQNGFLFAFLRMGP